MQVTFGTSRQVLITTRGRLVATSTFETANNEERRQIQ